MTATIERLGDGALLLRLGEGIDLDSNRRVHALAARLAAERPGWLRDIVPGYASLALFVDPTAFADAIDPLAAAETWLRPRLDESAPGPGPEARLVEIPVCYGGEFGPDLADWSDACDLDADTAIARHAGGEYRVALLGFTPGFPYLLGLDPALAAPRLATPRTCVPAGSVGIGGAQTGIYPQPGPGGWRLIGRTPLRLFDAGRDPPAWLAPGDRVRFVAIDAGRFRALAGAP